jgi:hypothetical protein
VKHVGRFLAHSVAWRPPGERGEVVDEHERLVLDTGGVVIRYGQLYGPGTFYDGELPDPPRVHVDEAAIATHRLLDEPPGVVTIADDQPAPKGRLMRLTERPLAPGGPARHDAKATPGQREAKYRGASRQAAANARLNTRRPCRSPRGRRSIKPLGEKARRSAEFFGEPYEKSFGPADVAEPIRVFVLDHFAADKLRAVLTEPGERLVDVVHGEHHA